MKFGVEEIDDVVADEFVAAVAVELLAVDVE